MWHAWTAYCREHCTSRRCCGRLAHGRDEHPSRDLRQSSPVVHAPLRQYLSEMCSGIPEDVGQLPAHIRNSLEELREFASAGGRRKCQRLSSAPPPPREPTYVRLALLNCNRLWLPGGSEHPAFHGLVGLLQAWDVDLMCIQETRAPLGAALPIDRPFVYDGPQGIDGCEAGFLVKNTSPSWSVSSRSTSSRFRLEVSCACP